MKNRILLLVVFFLLALNLFSQEKVTVNIENRSISELFDAIEQQTNYRIFSQAKDIDSLSVSINSIDEDPMRVINNALQGTQLRATLFDNAIFILRDKELVTSLPIDFIISGEKTKTGDEYDLSELALLEARRAQRAISESRVYDIGDISRKKTGRVYLSGNVLNLRTGEPMVGVSVFIKDPSISTSTDSKGQYRMQLPVGRNELYLQGVEVKDTRIQLMVYSDGNLDIEVEEEVYMLSEASVTSERISNVRSTTMGMERVRIKDIKNIPTAFGEVDIIRAVLSLPGVKSTGEVSSGFNVRGGATDQNLILFNDGTIYNPSHLFGLFSAFNPDIIKDMELYKSSIPVKYGGRISSVLDINSREGNKEKIEGSASIGLLTSRLMIEGPIFKNKTSFLVGGRTTYSDWILKQLPEKSGYKEGSAGFYDINASINHKFSAYNNLAIHGYYSSDRFRFTTDQKYAYRNANASLKWRHIFSEQLVGTLTAGYDHYDYSTKDTETSLNAYELTFDINQLFGKLDFSWRIGKHTIDFGASAILYSLSPGSYVPLGEESLVRDDHIQKEKALESALYLGETWDITGKFSINAGIRYSLFNVLGPRTYSIYDPGYLPSLSTIIDIATEKSGIFKTYHGPEFRFSTRYAFSNDFSVKAGVNTMRQNIHKISNTTIMAPTDTWKLSDANIKPQKGMQAAAGLYKNFFNGAIETSIEGYYKIMDDYLDYRTGAELIMNHHIETDVLSAKGRAYGIELMVKKVQGKLTGWLSYTYSKAQLKQDDPLIEKPVNSGDWYLADFDKPHDVKFVWNYKLTHRYSFSLNCDYSTGRPITLPLFKYTYSNSDYVHYSERNRYRVPDFFRVDISFNIEPGHHLKKLTHSMLSFGVYNVTGQKNAYSIYYVSEKGKLQGYKLSIFGAPIPYVSYSIKF